MKLQTYESKRFNFNPKLPRFKLLDPIPLPLPRLVGVDPDGVELAAAALAKLASACCCCRACKLAIIVAVAIGFPPDNPEARDPREPVAKAACKYA